MSNTIIIQRNHVKITIVALISLILTIISGAFATGWKISAYQSRIDAMEIKLNEASTKLSIIQKDIDDVKKSSLKSEVTLDNLLKDWWNKNLAKAK